MNPGGGGYGMNPNTGGNVIGKGNTGRKRGQMAGDVIPQSHRAGTLQQFTPEMMDLFQQLIGQLGPDSYLAKLAAGDPELFAEMEAPALQQFSATQGNIASRFSGMGGLGARKSSGFGNTMNQASSNFAQQLQSNRQGLMRQAQSDLQGFGNSLLQQKPQERILQEREPSWAEQWVPHIMDFAGQVAGGAARGHFGKV